MDPLIGIYAKSPTVLRGITAVVGDAGFAAVPLPSLSDWVPGRGGSVVIAVIRDEGVADAARTFCEDHPHVPLIAISPEGGVGAIADSIRRGAITAIGEDEPEERIVTAVEAALEGMAVLSADVAAAMAAHVPPTTNPEAWVDEREAEWLRQLAAGVTVPAIAAASGYSEREMFRVLQRLYRRLDVKGRTEAIVWASKQGLL
jgi:DNA-binding NarL/FixJ family response regulator